MQRQPKKFGRRYPWRSWFAKGRFRLRKGKHYDQNSYVFMQMIRNVASQGRAGVKKCNVSIQIAKDELYIDVEVRPIKRAKRADTKGTT